MEYPHYITSVLFSLGDAVLEGMFNLIKLLMINLMAEQGARYGEKIQYFHTLYSVLSGQESKYSITAERMMEKRRRGEESQSDKFLIPLFVPSFLPILR